MVTELEPGARAAKTRTGTVQAVCYSPTMVDGVLKEAHEEAEFTTYGIPGDYHYGETRYSRSRGKRVPNDRPISVVGYEAGFEACNQLGCEQIRPGGLGENLLVNGLGDLSELAAGDRIVITPQGQSEPAVVLEVTLQNPPCANLRVYHRLMVKTLMGKRGVICLVRKEGKVRVGDTATIIYAAR